MNNDRMTSRKGRVAVAAAFGALVGLGGLGTAAAQEATVAASNPRPVRLFVQAGSGLVELAHLEMGTFIGPHVSVEATVAWPGVFGMRYGAGAFYTFGHAQGSRPPRHGLLVGARLMLNQDATFNTHGDDLSSYGVIPVGYSFLSESGFFFRTTVGAAIVREQTRSTDATTATSVVEHRLRVGGPLFTVAFGFAWDGP